MATTDTLFTIKEVTYVVGPIIAALIGIVSWLFMEWYKGLHKKVESRDYDLRNMKEQVSSINRTLESHKKGITDNLVTFKTEMISQQEKINSSIHLHRDELQKTRYVTEKNERAVLQAIQDLKAVETALYANSDKIKEFTTRVYSLPDKVMSNTNLCIAALKVMKRHNERLKSVTQILDAHKMLILSLRDKK